MLIELEERVQVAAPLERVWQFLMVPENIVGCMPGAVLKEKITDKVFIGTVKIKLGAITAQYEGKVTYAETDPQSYTAKILAEATEYGGGTASATIITQLIPLPDGKGTEVQCRSQTDLTGRLVQVGRGMIEGVSAAIIKKYIANARTQLETFEERAEIVNAPVPEHVSSSGTQIPKDSSINLAAIIWDVIKEKVRALFKKLFSRQPAK